MTKLRQSMVNEAVKKYGGIKACYGKTFEDSFTKEENMLIFWFNDSSGSTRVITKILKGEENEN